MTDPLTAPALAQALERHCDELRGSGANVSELIANLRAAAARLRSAETRHQQEITIFLTPYMLQELRERHEVTSITNVFVPHAPVIRIADDQHLLTAHALRAAVRGAETPTLEERIKPATKLLTAALNADWQQVVMNGGPPCFHLEGDKFCLRAERWMGHDGGPDPGHPFVSLAVLLAAAVPPAHAGLIEEAPGVYAAPRSTSMFATAEAAPLPPQWDALQPLKDACDRTWSNETPTQIIAIAANAISWRDQEIARLKALTDETRTAVETVLRGFEEGVFVRSTDHDHESGWAIKLMPFVAALGVLQRAVLSALPPPATPGVE